MRQWINLFESPHDDLATAIGQLDLYINGNDNSVDHYEIARVLRRHGYHEPVTATTFFRALYHTVPVGDARTVDEFFQQHRDGRLIRMEKSQGACTTLDGALSYLGGLIHLTRYIDHVWPEHRPDTPLSKAQAVYIVYEFVVPAGSVLWSMAGLRRFLDVVPDTLRKPLQDAFSEYEHDREVMVDTARGHVTATHLYDSTEHEEEYTNP